MWIKLDSIVVAVEGLLAEPAPSYLHIRIQRGIFTTETLPIIAKIDDGLRRLHNITKSLEHVEQWLDRWLKMTTDWAWPPPHRVAGRIFGYAIDAADDHDKPALELLLQEVVENSTPPFESRDVPIPTDDNTKLSAVEIAVIAFLVTLSRPHAMDSREAPAESPGSVADGIEVPLRELRSISRTLDHVRKRLCHWKATMINATSSISVLPAEIISCIFSHVMDIAKNYYRSEVALTLSLVCRFWRSVALTQSALWTDIHVMWPHERQNAWCKRSKQRPLQLIMRSGTSNLSPDVLDSLSRLETITAENLITDRFLQTISPDELGHHLPMLREIHVEIGTRPKNTVVLALPGLRCVSLSGVFLTFLNDMDTVPPLPWTDLSITGPASSVRCLMKLFAACGQLRALRIRNACLDDNLLQVWSTMQLSGISPGLVIFPHLNEIYLHVSKADDGVLGLFGPDIKCPALSSLTIHYAMDPQILDETQLAWHALYDIEQLLSEATFIRRLALHGHPAASMVLLDGLAEHSADRPDLMLALHTLDIDVTQTPSLNPEETWSGLQSFMNSRVEAFGDRPGDVLDTLCLRGAPAEWAARTIPRIGRHLLAPPPSDNKLERIVIRARCAGSSPTCEGQSTSSLLYCARCLAVRYCGIECQKSNWLVHKQKCPSLQ